jgi:hypothetical protein
MIQKASSVTDFSVEYKKSIQTPMAVQVGRLQEIGNMTLILQNGFIQ